MAVRLLRPEAAAYISEQLGSPVSPRTMEVLPVPFVVLNKRAAYLPSDLDEYVAQVLAAAPRRTGRPRRSRKQMVAPAPDATRTRSSLARSSDLSKTVRKIP